MSQLQSITIKGYKSIRELVDFEIRPINVLIGSNGAGKSNFLSAFKFLASVVGDNFPVDVQVWGGPDALLHYGRKITPRLEMEVCFKSEPSSYRSGRMQNGYKISLKPTNDNQFVFAQELPWFYIHSYPEPLEYSLGTGYRTARVTNDQDEASKKVSAYVSDKLKSWRQYHFHDTGDTALVKRLHKINDRRILKPDAANLAACLCHWATKYQSNYQRIVETIRLVAPFFGDFIFTDDDTETVELEWTERGYPDTPWKAHVLSDGTLRFMCLASLLLQPIQLLPDIIIIDEPELGLHPFAINVLAGLLKRAAEENQVIVSTQSVELLNAFEPEDIVVVERENNASVFKRLDTDDLKDWLEDYTLGELWKRNILGGRPKP
ncbi:MAG: AAA family ATPase [Proteobacteria bacterium]|nr:AAA family ATPase [Pseudomonadota bacterium]